MKQNKGLSGVFIILGAMLLAAAIGLVLFSAQKRASLTEVTAKMQALLSETTAGMPGEQAGEEMPRLEIGGKDYIGLLELPGQGVILPVAAEWETGSFRFCPARYSGTIYDGSLVIGGSHSKSCFAFISRLDAGEHIYFTDVQGVRYAFTVSKIAHRTLVDLDELQAAGSPLSLFAKKGSTYFVVQCTPS